MSWTPKKLPDLSSKTYAITGGNSGLGLEGAKILTSKAERGAYPLVLAAADPDAEPGAYYGPTGPGQMRGPVGKSFVDPRAKDEAVARRLWEVSEELAGPFFAEG